MDQEADTTLNQRHAEPCVVSRVSTECETDILKGKVSIRAPEVIKGPKKKREDVLEKKGKKKKTDKKKRYYHQLFVFYIFFILFYTPSILF